MTYKQFLAALRKTPRTWRINKAGEIRCKKLRCPLGTFMEKDNLPDVDLYESKELPILKSLSRKVADAADNVETKFQRIRGDLLRACSLKERTLA